MIQTFITSFKLKNTYRVNTILYSIKGIPLINKLLPESLYQNKGLKVLGNIISILYEIASTFLGKLIYVLFLIFLVSSFYETTRSDAFLHIFVFLTLIGGLMNTYLFEPGKDKYYAIILMHMKARNYALSNYGYNLLKTWIGFLPYCILFGHMAGVPFWICLLLPIFVVSIKLSVIYYYIRVFEKTGIVKNENAPTKMMWILIVLLLIIAYGLPYLGVTINQSIFILFFIIFLGVAMRSFLKMATFQDYPKLYKQLLTEKNVYFVQAQQNTQLMKETISKQIEYDDNMTSNKTGFSYFHDLFVKRHSKILTKAVKKQTFVIFLIFLFLILASLWNPKFAKTMNEITLTWLPYFVFIMYMLNRGTTLTQAMFMNCDHSMLTYRIYRTPKVILGIFKERLKTLILANFFPALFIGGGLTLTLFVSGGTSNSLNYIILFLSIIAMSIFFSVHYLVMYYLLQPYDIGTEIKNGTYKLVQGVTYFFCYFMIQIKFDTIPFGIITIVFSILYSFISLLLVYKLAPTTFKIRL